MAKRRVRKKIKLSIKEKIDFIAVKNNELKNLNNLVTTGKNEIKLYAKKNKKKYLNGFYYEAFIDDSKKAEVNVDHLLTIIFENTFSEMLYDDKLKKVFIDELEQLKNCFAPAITEIRKWAKELDVDLKGIISETKLEKHIITFQKKED